LPHGRIANRSQRSDIFQIESQLIPGVADVANLDGVITTAARLTQFCGAIDNLQLLAVAGKYSILTDQRLDVWAGSLRQWKRVLERRNESGEHQDNGSVSWSQTTFKNRCGIP
jgi:hypothetical protein